ncbi:MAG: hypothetical protein U1F11_15065 [Steroidobacteraceae bacterium]
MLDLVDDVAAGAERLVAVACGDTDPDRELADRERADAVHAARVLHAEARDGLLDDALALAHRELFEGLVLEPRDGVALVVVAHPAFEGGITAAGRM